MTMEVGNLLSQVMLDMPSPGSENSTLQRPNPVVILTTSTLHAKGTPSASGYLIPGKCPRGGQDGRGISRGVPNTISSIAMTTRSESITPSADAAELWENANKALKELLAMKASIDACRWKAVWELGMELCQNKSKATKSLEEANAICSHVIQGAEVLCFATIKIAKVTYNQTVQEAKITQACAIQETEAAHSVAVRDTETQRASQAKLLQRQHGKIM